MFETSQIHGFRWLVTVAVLLLMNLTAFSGDTLSQAELNDLLMDGNRLFREANEQAAKNPDAANDFYRKAILRYERIIREGGIQNGGLYYNIGNAYFRMEDIGRAILNYRRAQRYIPNDPNLYQNLNYARARRLVTVDEAQEKKIIKTIFFWHYDLSTRIRSVLFGVCFVVLWIGASLRIFIKQPTLTWIVSIASILSVVVLTSLLIETVQHINVTPGVVLSDEVIARKGDSETYEPSFEDPIQAGTEFILIENRQDWYHIELVNGRQCWIPTRTAELLF